MSRSYSIIVHKFSKYHVYFIDWFRLILQFGLVHISTGDILRAEISAGSEIGNKAKEFMNSGRLVPDEIVTTVRRGSMLFRAQNWFSYLCGVRDVSFFCFVDGDNTVIRQGCNRKGMAFRWISADPFASGKFAEVANQTRYLSYFGRMYFMH